MIAENMSGMLFADRNPYFSSVLATGTNLHIFELVLVSKELHAGLKPLFF